MGGNGEKVQHTSLVQGFGVGNGGGCVKTGPFKEYDSLPPQPSPPPPVSPRASHPTLTHSLTPPSIIIRLGPLSAAISGVPRNPRADGYGDNKRCLRRDISNGPSSKYTRTQDIVNLISNYKSIGPFQDKMQDPTTGVHSAGHYTIHGDPGGDFYTSPNDPAFWLHHGMIDRTWTIWQSQDLANRVQVIAGGKSMMSFGGSGPQGSLEDLIDLGVVGDKVYKIKDLVSTVDGPFCYVYE